jgi:endo-1,4-beta-xylanase
VDAVGIQSHFQLRSLQLEGLDSAITTLGRLGYRVMLTELDLDVLPRSSGWARVSAAFDPSVLNPYPQELPDSVQRQLADGYAEIFRIVLRHPHTISRVTFWGAYDGSSWLNNWPIRGRTNYALLFDRRGAPKPAYWATIAALARHP